MSQIADYKRLIICCDGTWQASDKGHQNAAPSNVTKLCYALKQSSKLADSDREVQQIVYYQSGVGTGSLSDLAKKFQGGTGTGLNENVIEAYNFLVNNFEDGDEIFCFGFSRGAYTARCVAGLVCGLGVLPKSALTELGYIYSQWQKLRPQGENTSEWDYWWSHRARGYALNGDGGILQPNIKVCGVWDTVGALGIPQTSWTGAWDSNHQFHNPHLSNKIEHAFHALALDEHRAPFSPTLWHKTKDSTTNLIQCWFPGVHINVGGGSDQHESAGAIGVEPLADNALAWMIDLCSPFLSFNQSYISTFLNLRNLELERKTGAEKEYASAAFVDSYGWKETPAGSIQRAPGQYDAKNQLGSRTHVSGFDSTCEYMHVSVRYRYQNEAAKWLWNKPAPPSTWQTAKSYVWSSPAEPLFELVEDNLLPSKLKSGARLSKFKWVKKLGGGEVVELPEMGVGLSVPVNGVLSCEERMIPLEVLERIKAGKKVLV